MFGAPDVSLMYGVLMIILDNQYDMLFKVVAG